MNVLCFEDFNKELLRFLVQHLILSEEILREHKFEDGDLVFYYDGVFSNIHKLDLKECKDLHQEVLDNTKCYNKGKEWDLLTGIYFYLPENKKIIKMIDDSRVK